MVGVRHEESKAGVGDKDNAGKKVFFFFHKITEGQEECICKERLHDCEGSDGPLEHDVVESADASLQEEPLVFLAWVE